MTRANPSDFERLIADIEREAYDEGPQAVRELEQMCAEYQGVSESLAARRLLGNNLGNKLSETQKHSTAKPQQTQALLTDRHCIPQAGGRAVAGSNPVSPTSKEPVSTGSLCFRDELRSFVGSNLGSNLGSNVG